MKNLASRLLLLFLLLAPVAANAQSTGRVVADCTTGVPLAYGLGSTSMMTMLADGRACVTAAVSASITGFPGTTQTTGTPISVTTLGVTGTLPSGAVVVATNAGATNNAYCKLGASATTSDQLIAPNSWFAFTVGSNTQLTCITSTSTTTVNMVGGSGLPTGAGGGGGGSGGGGAITAASGSYSSGALSSGSIASGAVASGAIASGAYSSGSIGSGAIASGAVASGAYSSGSIASGAFASGSIASGAVVDLGVQADSVCGTATGTCSLIALIKYLNTVAGTAIPAGTNLIGGVNPLPATSGGLSVYNIQPGATDNHAVIKAGAGQVYKVDVFNNSATVNYIRLYNATTGFNGCNSATNIVWQGIIPASTSGSGLSSSWDLGIAFATGISICVTSGYAQTDTTAATASALIVNVGYK